VSQARTEVSQPDGRRVWLYGESAPAPPGYQPPARSQGAYQIRWNVLRREWVLNAASRQARTFLPERESCPLCPAAPGRSTEIPAATYQVAVFENRFPALLAAKPGRWSGGELRSSAGSCEVVVYTAEHEGSFAALDAPQLAILLEAWTDRYRELAAREDVRYVFIFENRGEAVGVTLHHPHGQIYAYPFVPPVAATELRPGRGRCRLCALLEGERRDGRRIVKDAGAIVSYVPAAARWPYEVHVVAAAHQETLAALSPVERTRFGQALQSVALAYDRLFQAPMPYMMVIHQRPTAPGDWPQAHLHAEFYPLLRDRGRLKYLAGSESGAGVFINDTLPEESAERLRAATESVA
jgi:UDPglucose--hexose-1-phosphate uridylyltransferase